MNTFGNIHNKAKELFHRFYKDPRKAKKAIISSSLDLKDKYYLSANRLTGVTNTVVIIMFDGKFKHGGLADRLRGIISVYEICKKLGIPFRIYFKHPVGLETFLEPDRYDWRIEENEISYNPSEAVPLFFIDIIDKINNPRRYMTKQIKALKNKQIHIYTNVPFSLFGDYSASFHELFKPTGLVDKELNHYRKVLGPKYISVSTRFMNLLGDFNEADSFPLQEYEQKKLIDSCIGQIEKLHAAYPDHKVFVASDSRKFLEAANTKEYVSISDGTPSHIDNIGNLTANDSFKNALTDFLIISEADSIFMLHTGQMYKGGFAFSASRVNNRPYRQIDF